MDSFAYLIWKILKKKLIYNRDFDRQSVRVVEFVMMRA